MNKILFKEIETNSLKLRKLRESDAAVILELRSNEDVNKYLDRPHMKQIKEAEKFIAKINKGINRGEWFFWIINNLDGKSIGTICLWNFNLNKTIAEIGFEILPEFQGKGLMKEAAKAVIHFGFETLNLNEIRGQVAKANKRSIYLMKKLGFEGPYKNEDLKSSNTVYYSLKNKDNNYLN